MEEKQEEVKKDVIEINKEELYNIIKDVITDNLSKITLNNQPDNNTQPQEKSEENNDELKARQYTY